jgi:hypothetical protein
LIDEVRVGNIVRIRLIQATTMSWRPKRFGIHHDMNRNGGGLLKGKIHHTAGFPTAPISLHFSAHFSRPSIWYNLTLLLGHRFPLAARSASVRRAACAAYRRRAAGATRFMAQLQDASVFV